jgi:hypothetical protein
MSRRGLGALIVTTNWGDSSFDLDGKLLFWPPTPPPNTTDSQPSVFFLRFQGSNAQPIRPIVTAIRFRDLSHDLYNAYLKNMPLGDLS